MSTDSLTEHVQTLVTRWQLQLETDMPPGLPHNVVVGVRRVDGTRCVLKVSPYLWETRTEGAALALWDGRGAARLLADDAELGGLLLERIEPGTRLDVVAAGDDKAATRIATGLLPALWQPASEGTGLPSLESWCAAYDRNRAAILAGDAGDFPRALFERADALRAELLETAPPPVALHGDFHHFNILRSDRAGWLAIDPKGLYGDPCFDVCQFLWNPMPATPSIAVNRRRVDIFCTELGLDRRRTRDWCLVHAVLDACWSLEKGSDWRPRIAYAQGTLLF